MEWKLFEDGTVPRCSTVPFFEQHPWTPPEAQSGHTERTAMVTAMVREIVPAYGVTSLSDLGCGDGKFLDTIRDLTIKMWGYDAGTANVAKAAESGLDVRQGDIFGPVEYGELITSCEVIEHLEDPHGFVAGLPGRLLVVSSPSAEDGEWHYVDHTWAWDLDGYAALVTGAGWEIVDQRECDGGVNWHFGITRPQRFQAIFAERT